MSTPTRCPEEDQLACYLRLPFMGPRRVSTPLRRGGNGEEVQIRGICMMDQILLRRSDEHTPRLKRNVSRPTSSMTVLKLATLCLLPPPPVCAGQQSDQVHTDKRRIPGGCRPRPPRFFPRGCRPRIPASFPGAAAPGPPLLSHGMWRLREDTAREILSNVLNPWTESIKRMENEKGTNRAILH